MSLAAAIYKINNKALSPVISKAKPFDILEVIKERLTSERVNGVPLPDDYYRVSSLVRLCPRQEVLRLRHKVISKEKIDHKLQKTFDIGSALHWWIQNKWFGPWGYLVGHWRCIGCSKIYDGKMPSKCECGSVNGFLYEELTFEDKELRIQGHCDGVLDAGDELKILEIKSCNSIQFNIATVKQRDAFAPHKDQLQMYMFMSGIRSGIILYFEKDTSMVHDFRYEYDKSAVDRVLRRLEQAREAMRTDVLPPREICQAKDCSRAKSCPVRTECFK